MSDKRSYNINKKNKNYPELILSDDDFVLNIGDKRDKEGNKNEINLSFQNRLSNLAIIGDKNTGKTSKILPYLFWQDSLKPCGVTVVSYRKEISYTLYAIAKNSGKEVHYIKPSIDGYVLNLMCNDMDYASITQDILDYKKAIKDKDIIIIDLENFKYENAPIILKKIFDNFKYDLQDINYTLKNPHMLYIDDADSYQEYLVPFLKESDTYNVCVTLLYQSRILFEELIRNQVDLNIRNYILASSLNISDRIYFRDKYNFDIEIFNRLRVGEYLLKIENDKTNINVTIRDFPKDIQELIDSKSTKIRRKTMKVMKKEDSKLQETLLKKDERTLAEKLNIASEYDDDLDDIDVRTETIKVINDDTIKNATVANNR